MKEKDLSILLKYLIKEKEYVPFDVIEKTNGTVIPDVFLSKNAKVTFTISKLSTNDTVLNVNTIDKMFKVKDKSDVIELSISLKKIRKQSYISSLTLRGYPIIAMSSNIRITQKKKGVHEIYYVNPS